MKIHCIRHEPFEGLACIEDWINHNNHELSCTYTYLHQSFPGECTFDLLIIMGGTASIYNSLQESWYLEEKQFIEACISQGRKVLGICLGAQIIASILGSRIYPAKSKEVGWYPVEFNKELDHGMEFLPDWLNTFHWHGDTFDIPQDAVPLASSELTPNQGFTYNNHVFAMQFHPEMTKTGLQKLIRASGRELMEKGKYIQTAEQIMEKDYLTGENNALMYEILDYLVNA